MTGTASHDALEPGAGARSERDHDRDDDDHEYDESQEQSRVHRRCQKRWRQVVVAVPGMTEPDSVRLRRRHEVVIGWAERNIARRPIYGRWIDSRLPPTPIQLTPVASVASESTQKDSVVRGEASGCPPALEMISTGGNVTELTTR
jgi:hypothetical protein